MAFDYAGIPPEQTTQLRMIARRAKELIPCVIPIIIELGRRLEVAKAILPHGRFGCYCKEEIGISGKSAQNYMNVARLARVRNLADLEKLAPGAAYELAAKNTPESVVSEVLSDTRAGHSVTEDEVKERIAKTKGQGSAKTTDLSHVDQLAHLLVDALDFTGVREIEFFLRSAEKTAIRALSDRLRDAMNGGGASTFHSLN